MCTWTDSTEKPLYLFARGEWKNQKNGAYGHSMCSVARLMLLTKVKPNFF